MDPVPFREGTPEYFVAAVGRSFHPDYASTWLTPKEIIDTVVWHYGYEASKKLKIWVH